MGNTKDTCHYTALGNHQQMGKMEQKSKMWIHHLKCPVLLEHTATERLSRYFQYAVSFKVPVSTTGIMLTVHKIGVHLSYEVNEAPLPPFHKLYTSYTHANVSINKQWPLPWTELQTCFQKETLSSRVRDSSLIVSSQNTKMQPSHFKMHFSLLTSISKYLLQKMMLHMLQSIKTFCVWQIQ